MDFLLSKMFGFGSRVISACVVFYEQHMAVYCFATFWSHCPKYNNNFDRVPLTKSWSKLEKKQLKFSFFFFQAKKNESVFLLRKQSIKIDFGNVLLITTECIYWKIPRNGVGRSMSKKIKMFLVLRQNCAWLT